MATKGPLTENEIAKAVSIGLCSLSRHGTTHRSLFRIFIYPILLTYFATLGCILISHFIVPYFEEMYVEFGVMVPRMTTFFFYVGHLFRTYTITILLILLGVPPLLWLINWIGHENRPPGMSRLDVMLSRKRSTTARWLFHLSLLLDAGLTKEDAIERAASISGKLWIKRKAVAFKNNIDDASNVNVRFFGGQKSRMADTAISMPRSRGQVALLRHVATWYRDSSSNLIEWLVQLLIPLYVFCILIGSLLLIVSLLSPILSVISALTGGGGGAPGGFM
jgi:type II secretory pathway component PulF